MSAPETSSTSSSCPKTEPPRESAHKGCDSAHLPPPNVHRIVLTGGPCGGKTSAIEKLSHHLRKCGFTVFTVTEIATLLYSNGATPALPHIQREILRVQLALEDSATRLGRDHGKPTVIICDRGCLDGRAYVTSAEWEAMVGGCGLNTVELRDARYLAVFHLVTAAKGAEEFYTKANNKVRRESPEEARVMDEKVYRAWHGHPHLTVVDNTGSFADKLTYLMQAASKALGLPSSFHPWRRFQLECAPTEEEIAQLDLSDSQAFDVEKVYLRVSGWAVLRERVRSSKSLSAKSAHSAGLADPLTEIPPFPYAFVRRRTYDGVSVFSYTFGNKDRDGKIYEESRIISEDEFRCLKTREASPFHHVVLQRRIAFLYRDQSYEIKINKDPCPGVAVIYCQQREGKWHPSAPDTPSLIEPQTFAGLEFPGFLKIAREISDDFSTYMFTMARKSPLEE